ncbi:MAG: peptide deformylase [Spirochaetaceae bacterium]|jgi:peptide deformylase|nr:peptide deformylase [Spirochaetaceae bacterium]
MNIVTLGNEFLAQKALPVKKITPKYKEIAEEMAALMIQKKGVGLAGPQVGVMERIFVIQDGKTGILTFINPTIIATSEELVKYEEGCLSIPGVWANVMRPKTITVQAWNEKGRPFTIEAEGVLARIVQHEYDHLEGILFIDRIPETKKARILAQYKKTQKTID